MRIKARFKKFSTIYYPLEYLSAQKIFKLHRPKWKKLQKILYNKISNKNYKKQPLNIKNNISIFCPTNRWVRNRFLYKSRLILKKIIQNHFLNSLSNKNLKKLCLKKKSKKILSFLQNIFLKTEFRFDILLCRLRFFINPDLVKKECKKRNIFLNKENIGRECVLLKGDILNLTTPQIIVFSKERIWSTVIFHTFLEIDYYTNTIIVIKDFKELSKKDFFLITKSLYKFLDLQDYLLK